MQSGDCSQLRACGPAGRRRLCKRRGDEPTSSNKERLGPRDEGLGLRLRRAYAVPHRSWDHSPPIPTLAYVLLTLPGASRARGACCRKCAQAWGQWQKQRTWHKRAGLPGKRSVCDICASVGPTAEATHVGQASRAAGQTLCLRHLRKRGANGRSNASGTSEPGCWANALSATSVQRYPDPVPPAAGPWHAETALAFGCLGNLELGGLGHTANPQVCRWVLNAVPAGRPSSAAFPCRSGRTGTPRTPHHQTC
jgi:hypothetical protein